MFASGDYNKLTYEGFAGLENEFKLTKKKLTVHRKITVEDTPITCDIIMDPKGMDFKTVLTPNEDAIVEKFPVAQSFMELDGEKYEYAAATGMINIWRIVKRFSAPLFFHQVCEKHFKRMFVMEIDEDVQEMFSEIWNYDEFYMIPNHRDPETSFVVHDHRSHISKKERVIFILRVENGNGWKLDPKAGGVWLYERKDENLMNFEFKDLDKMSRRLNTIYSLRSG